MIEATSLFDLLKQFFAATYKPDKREYHVKLTYDHLQELVRQIDFFMAQNYLNPETVTDRIKPLAELNNQLQTCLRIAVDNAHRIYVEACRDNSLSSEEAEGSWQHAIQNNKGWKIVFSMLTALELHDPKQKEKYDAELKNNGN